MSDRSVVVTGLGAVTAAGMGVEALWRATAAGESGAREVTLPRDYGQIVKIAAQAPALEVTDVFPDKRPGFFDRATTLALAAAVEAIGDAGLNDAGSLGPRTGVIVGTGIGSFGTIEDGVVSLLGGRRPDPLSIPRAMTSAAASQIGMAYGCTGPTFVVSSACASSAQAIGLALQMLRSGLADRVIAVGTEAVITPGGMKGWEAMRVLSPDRCRPFSKGRNGLLLGEGAAALILETAGLAGSRGARVRSRLMGYGTTSDAKDILRPDAEGARSAMAMALDDAGAAPEAIGYVNAHGTATVLNDTTESEALGRVFGQALAGIPVTSTKPVHGHTLGAAGAIEAVITVRALEERFVPPTINFLEPDPHCPVDCVPHTGRAHAFDMALTNSFAFGGINAALVFGRA
ncbi:beta-ketoacyl-[acyl-carrier-protein] synthase family protein [Phreatobacter sp.]|uniref:beta-ketoacyl-[acyl-carrier-protein] synthase family protein n=1 Tax=Phreatobacter sp. TaxID=1966341 RepID=UPI003F6FBB3B